MGISCFACLVLVHFFMFFSIADVDSLTADESALLALKAYISPETQNILANWTTATSVCNWVGVTCTGQPQKVIALNLSHMGINGTLPPQIGTVASSLANMTSLKKIDLSYNQLSGSIASSIFNMSSLQIIDLCYNRLGGKFPADMFNNLPDLKELFLSGNHLYGHIPSSLFYCRHLRRIVLSGNPLDTMLPVSIGNLSNSLEYLWLADCKLKGSIPSEVGNLSNLIALRLENNILTGVIPNTIGRLEKLQSLRLEGNKLGGIILNDVCELSNLFELFLGGNKLSGSIPECLSNLRALRYLSLNSNRLNSTIPSSLWSLKDILVINMSSNCLQGSLPLEIGSLEAVFKIDLSKNQLSGHIPDSIWCLRTLAYLSLAVNRLQGPIPETCRSFVNIEFLDLSFNNLSGAIPNLLERWIYLQHFNVSFNELEGEIPSAGPFGNFSAQSYVRNKALCGEARLQVPKCRRTGTRKSSRQTILLFTKILLPVIASTCILPQLYRAMKHCLKMMKDGLKRKSDPLLTTNRTILFQEIELATDGFSESNLLGTGSCGSVYKGTMKEEKHVAIKVFNLHLERGLKSFQVESELLSWTRHPNLVKLMNSCCDDDFRALVLEYMPNGTLDKWLYTHNYFLNLLQRLDIMIEVASAMSYLHSIHVIHCDLKPSNVLLDEDMVARVSDFSIAKFLGDFAVIQRKTLGTVGYMAPEYGSSGIISEKTDVYSFGILLMETFTGKKPTDDIFNGEMNLRRWIFESLPHEVESIIDVTLLQSDQEDIEAKTRCVKSIMQVAWYCTAESYLERKTMIEVEFRLHRIRSRFLMDTNLIECQESPRETYPRISYQELNLATGGFSESNLLDMGRSGFVYKGILEEERIIAVKIFNPQKSWLECFYIQSQVLSFIRHRNVVKILKCCSDIDFKALVLEYMPNGSLQKYLYPLNHGMDVLKFLQRLDIMINVASALCYLHSMRVIHCNLNPSNVLLNNDMVARLSGFSIAKCLDKGISATKSTIMATVGYMAPEWESTGTISEKTDVYSFGILLAETFTMIRPMEEMNWRSRICYPLQVADTIVDLNLLQIDDEHLAVATTRCLPLILTLAYCCTAELPDERKTMTEVETDLVRIKKRFLSYNRQAMYWI